MNSAKGKAKPPFHKEAFFEKIAKNGRFILRSKETWLSG